MIIARNPWSAKGGLDPQRSDLWMVDLTDATSVNGSLMGVLTRIFPNEMARVDQGSLKFQPSTLTLPEVRMNGEIVKESSTPRMVPGSDDPMQAVRLTFRMTSRTSDDTYTVFELWRELARVGRQGYYYSGLAIPVLSTGSYSIPFRFDLPLRFLRGLTNPGPLNAEADLSTLSAAFSDADTLSDSISSAFANSPTFEDAATYILKDVWCANLQIGDANMDSSQVLTCSALLYPRYILDKHKDLSPYSANQSTTT